MVLFFLVFRFKCFSFFVEAPTAEQTYRGVKERYLKVANSHDKVLYLHILGNCILGAEKIFRPPPTTPTHGYFVLSPVSLASRDQDGGPSNSTIDVYDLTEK